MLQNDPIALDCASVALFSAQHSSHTACPRRDLSGDRAGEAVREQMDDLAKALVLQLTAAESYSNESELLTSW